MTAPYKNQNPESSELSGFFIPIKPYLKGINFIGNYN
nr:MAG TPA: hypothetical protein [Bacteriophage sp.]